MTLCKICLWLCLCSWLFPGCGAGSRETGYSGNRAPAAPKPASVQKKVNKKVFVHLMPWFESSRTHQPPGTWGIHWTMANRNPDSIIAGRRQIASFYYPLIGPYASGDPKVIRYQLLLMKLSGVDGVFIDWPGTAKLYDYPENAANADSIIRLTRQVGLHYALVYEDQNINIAFGEHAITDKIGAARNDMRFMERHYFSDPGYEQINGRPLVLDFGPQTFLSENDWTEIFAVLKRPPAFFTLWDHGYMAGKNVAGRFAWINSDNLSSLRKFYATRDSGLKIASAYPGFNPYYKKGGWGGPSFVIPSAGTGNFKKTLELAIQSDAGYIQIPTWNDYGEGTMIEPTREYGYSMLTTLQQALGVNFNQADLETVARYYELCKKNNGNAPAQIMLEEVFRDLVSLQVEKANALMNQIR